MPSSEASLASDRTLSFITLPAWVYAAKRCGFAIEPLLEELGLTLDLVHLEALSVRESSLERLMLACVAGARAHHFPFVLAETLGFEYLPELQTFLRTCPTPRHALRAGFWIRGLLNPQLGARLEEQGELAWLWFEFGGRLAQGPAATYFSETRMAMVANLIRLFAGQAPPLTRVWFRHAAPPYVSEYARYFGGTLEFDRPEYGMAAPRAALDRPLDGAHPLLHRQAELRLAERAKRGARALGISARVLRVFTSDPALMGEGIAGIARRLGLHPRTLQRRLRDQGDNFAELVARARMHLAASWLQQRTTDLDTIAARLGYADRRSFSRAFTRWAGVAPSYYRRASLPAELGAAAEPDLASHERG